MPRTIAAVGSAKILEAVDAFAQQIPTVLFDANLEGVGEVWGEDHPNTLGCVANRALCLSELGRADVQKSSHLYPSSSSRL